MDIERARQQVEMARARLAEMEQKLQTGAARISSRLDPTTETLQQIVLRPKRKDVAINWSGILWLPFWHLTSGTVEPGFVV